MSSCGDFGEKAREDQRRPTRDPSLDTGQRDIEVGSLDTLPLGLSYVHGIGAP